jgi:hypothetical protein
MPGNLLYKITHNGQRKPESTEYLRYSSYYFIFFIFILFLISFIHMCIQCLGHFSPLHAAPSLSPTPSLSPPPPHYQAETILPLSLILLKREYSNNRKEQGVLLVEIRIAIQGVDSHCFPVRMCYILS